MSLNIIIRIQTVTDVWLMQQHKENISTMSRSFSTIATVILFVFLALHNERKCNLWFVCQYWHKITLQTELTALSIFYFVLKSFFSKCYCHYTELAANFEDIFVSSEDWKSKAAEEVVYLVTPVPFAVVYHTATDECGSIGDCSVVLEKLQKRLMDHMLFANIGSKCVEEN